MNRKAGKLLKYSTTLNTHTHRAIMFSRILLQVLEKSGVKCLTTANEEEKRQTCTLLSRENWKPTLNNSLLGQLQSPTPWRKGSLQGKHDNHLTHVDPLFCTKGKKEALPSFIHTTILSFFRLPDYLSTAVTFSSQSFPRTLCTHCQTKCYALL